MDTTPPGRRERKREATIDKIITTAITLFHQYGLQEVTMEQIAAEVDIAKGTLYHHFPSKEAIIVASLQRTFQERNPERLANLRQLPDTRARMTTVFGLLIEGIQTQKEIFAAFWIYRMKQVISFDPAEDEKTGLVQLVDEIIHLGQQNGELRTDLPDDLLSGLFEFAFIAAIQSFYRQPDHFNANETIARCVDLFLNGAQA